MSRMNYFISLPFSATLESYLYSSDMAKIDSSRNFAFYRLLLMAKFSKV